MSSNDSQNPSEYLEMIQDVVNQFMDEFPSDWKIIDNIKYAIEACNISSLKKSFGEKTFNKKLQEMPLPFLCLKIDAYKNSSYPTLNLLIENYKIEEGVLSINLDSPFNRFENLVDNMMKMDTMDYFELGFPSVNRSVIVLNYKQAALDWVNSLSQDEKPFTMEEMESNAYLVKEKQNDEKIEKWLNKNFDMLFKLMLSEWSLDQEQWPKNRTIEMFYEWFDATKSAMVLDLQDGKLRRE